MFELVITNIVLYDERFLPPVHKPRRRWVPDLFCLSLLFGPLLGGQQRSYTWKKRHRSVNTLTGFDLGGT